MAERAAIDTMVRFNETIRAVFAHCKQVLDMPVTGMKEMNRLVDKAILDKNATPSPLLKFYNQLAQTMGSDFCKKAMAELDQKMFKEYIRKLVNAHEYYLKVTRQAAHRESKVFMREQFGKV